MSSSRKKWTVVGGIAGAFALTPLAAAAGPAVFEQPLDGDGVVVTRAEPAATPSGRSVDPESGPTISPQSPSTPRSVGQDTPLTPVTPASPASPASPGDDDDQDGDDEDQDDEDGDDDEDQDEDQDDEDDD